MTTNVAGTELGQLRYKPWGELRATSGSNPADYTFTGQYSNVSDFGLLFYNARWHDPALGRMAQADSIVAPVFSAQALDRYSYVANDPVRYVDPTGHAYCPYSDCDIVVSAHNEKMQLRGNLRNAAEGLARDLGSMQDLVAMTSIVSVGASAYRTWERLLPALSGIFIGVSAYGSGSLMAALGADGCSGVGRDPSDCPGNSSYFADSGFHEDFRDGQNQLFHLWGYIAETSAPGNQAWGNFGQSLGAFANWVHEVGQSHLGFEGTSWNDYVLSEAGMQIGAMITDQSITPSQLADAINITVGTQGWGSGPELERLLEEYGPLGQQ